MLFSQVNIPLTSIAMRQASDLTASIKSILTSFSSMVSFLTMCAGPVIIYLMWTNEKKNALSAG